MIQMARFDQDDSYRHEEAANKWLKEMQHNDDIVFKIINVAVGGTATVFLYDLKPCDMATEKPEICHRCKGCGVDGPHDSTCPYCNGTGLA